MSEKGDQEKEEGEEETQYKNLTPEMREEIDECWDIFDKHKEGMISAYDLTQLLRWLKFNPTEREMKAYMEKYDKKKENRVSKDVAYAIVD